MVCSSAYKEGDSSAIGRRVAFTSSGLSFCRLSAVYQLDYRESVVKVLWQPNGTGKMYNPYMTMVAILVSCFLRVTIPTALTLLILGKFFPGVHVIAIVLGQKPSVLG